MPYIEISSGPGTERSVDLENTLCVGRDDSCDLVLNDAKVSRKHLRFDLNEGHWTVTDLGSTHGTFVNAERITRRTLADGDHVQVGATLLVLRATGDATEVIREVPTALPGSDAPPRDDARLRIFYELANAIGDLSDTDALLRKLLAGIVAVVGAERGAVGLCEPGGLRTISHTRPGAPREISFASEVQAAVLSRKSAILIQEAGRSETLVRQRIRSAMAAPLLARGRALGLLYVDDCGKVGRFSNEDLEFLTALGRVCSAAFDGAERFQSAMAVAEVARHESPLSALEGESPVMNRLRATLRNVAGADAHVVIHGESGSGKELVARALHTLSPRAEHPFVALNCAALPESMIESELFGHVRGAFTGADQARRGSIALAHRGVLFLDEIGELGASAQAKVLRAIQQGEVQPLGAEKPIHVNVRVIAASHKDLWAEVQQGRFREDLYYRLHVVDIAVPPLRARGDDIALLAKRFLARAAQKLGKPLVGFSTDALDALSEHPWPGNVRELHNEAERAAIVASGPLVEVWDLSARVRGAPESLRATRMPELGPAPAATLAERFAALEPTEKALVQQALALAKGNLSEAARELGITRIMMKRRVDRFGLGTDKGE